MNLKNFSNNLFVLFIIYFGLVLCITWTTRKIPKILYHKDKTKSVAIKFFITLGNVVLWVVATVLYLLNFNWFKEGLTGIMAGSGLIFVSLSFIFQETIRDVLDGVLLILSNSFKIGDIIRLKDLNVAGAVKDIKLLHTEIVTFENSNLIVPNSKLKEMTIENLRANKNICNFLNVNVSYGTDLNKMEEIIKDSIINHPLFVDIRTEEEKEEGIQPYTFLITDWNEKGANVRISAYTKAENGFKFLCSLRRELLDKFYQNGIYISYPTIRIWDSSNTQK